MKWLLLVYHANTALILSGTELDSDMDPPSHDSPESIYFSPKIINFYFYLTFFVC